MLPDPVIAYCLSGAAIAVLLLLARRNRKQGWQRRRVYLPEMVSWTNWADPWSAPVKAAGPPTNSANTAHDLLALIDGVGTCAHPEHIPERQNATKHLPAQI